MRTPLSHVSRKVRCAPSLESLENRQLLSGLLPLLGSDASHSTAVPALTSLAAGLLNELAPVASAVQHLGGSGLGNLAQSIAATPPSTPAARPHVNLDLKVDVLFVHLDSVHLNVSVAPLESTESLVSLGVGGKAGGLPKSGTEVTLGLGGSNLVNLGVGSSNSMPSLPGFPGGVSAPSVGGSVPGVVGLVLGDVAGTIQQGSPTEGAGGSAMSAPNAAASPTTTTASASTNAVLPSGGTFSSAATPALALVGEGIADGGAGSVVDAPLQAAALVDGGAGDPVASFPVSPADGAGGETPVVITVSLAPEGSGLATHFQPESVSRVHQIFEVTAAAPQAGWLAALLARLAPYLATLILAGVGFDLERRRRLRRAAKAARSYRRNDRAVSVEA